jgi:RNase P subunit RPR2
MFTRFCPKVGKHAPVTTNKQYNTNTIKCKKCGQINPRYLRKEESVKERLGNTRFVHGCGNEGLCADNLGQMFVARTPIIIVRCSKCGEQVDECDFVDG